eukprot:g1542.t1
MRNEVTPSSQRRRLKVCVIGGGLSGIVTVKELASSGHDVHCFEGSNRLGGAFNDAYKSCHLSVSNHWMAFSDFPAEEKDRVFWSAEQYIAYLYRYARHFGILDRFTFHTKVADVRRRKDPAGPLGVTYYVTLQRADSPPIVEHFDAVVVATGVNRDPKVPNFPGRAQFERSGGRVVHSLEYTRPKPFSHKRVVCVGAGESAADIVKEVSEVASKTYLSLRRGVSVATKYPMRSNHTNDAFHARVHYFSHPWLITWLFSDINRMISTEAFKKIDPVFYMIGKLNLEAGAGMNQWITKNENFVEALVNGSVSKVGAIRRLGAKRAVHFEDGTSVEADVVLCSTGFNRSYGFLRDLPSGVDLSSSRNLYKHMIHPDMGESLAFVGWVRPAEGGVPPLAEMQARYLALLLSGERKLPKNVRSHTLADARRERERFFITPDLDTLVHYPILMEELAEMIGCKANLFRILLTDPRFWWRLWFGSHQCAVYRLTGQGAMPGVARSSIERLPIAWFANPLASRTARKLFLTNVVSFVSTPFGIFESSW